jgi:hypothetical protein
MEAKRRQHRGMLAAAVSVAAVALLVPASSNAATTLGQVNPTQPAGVGNCQPMETYTISKSDASINSTAPFSGIITSWSTKATDGAGQQAQLKTISQVGNPGAVTYTIQNSTALESLTPSTLNTFSTRIPIQQGQRIGYFFPSGAVGSQSCYYFNPSNSDETAAGPNNGQPGSTFTDLDGSSNRLVNLSANLEADADGDGFGDETQDRCPGVSGSNGGCVGGGGSDTKKPNFGNLAFSATTFKAAGSGSAFTTRKKKHYPTGTKVSFSLSEAASVKFTVQRKTSGRKVSGKCKKRTSSNRRKTKCTLWKSVRGSFTVSGKAGKNTFTFRGRIGGHKLSRGSYRLSGVATDPAKNASVPKRKGFRIVR